MSEDLPPTLPDADAPPGTHPSSILLDENVGPPPRQTQCTFVYLIRAAWMYSPLPPINGAQPLHPRIKGEIFGFVNYTLSYQHFYFYQGRVLHTKAFAVVSTTATTFEDGGKPKRSTELDDVTGHNCAMTKEEYTTFAVTVLGLRPGLQHGTRQTERSLLNMLLDNVVPLTNLLAAVYLFDEPTDKHALARILALFSLLMLGAYALTPAIVELVWGQGNVVRRNLGSPRGDLAIICCQLILLACVANNTFHLWLNTSFEEKNFITPEALKYGPQGVHDILLLVKDNTFAIYVREPLPSSKDHIQKLQHNLRQHRLSPISSTFYSFEDTIVHWYCDLVLEEGINSTDSTGEENHIFAAYGLTPLKNNA